MVADGKYYWHNSYWAVLGIPEASWTLYEITKWSILPRTFLMLVMTFPVFKKVFIPMKIRLVFHFHTER
jgi:flagellar biosynthesis protein FliR